MERRVLIDPFQKVTEDDFEGLSRFPGESLDHVVKDIGIPDSAYTGFPVVQSGPAEITVGAGRFYNGGLVYFNDQDGGAVIDLLTYLPPVTRRWLAVTTWGTEVDAVVEPRTFMTNATTRETVARSKATEKWRWANLGILGGTEGPDPIKPQAAAGTLVIAWVLVSNAGIISIEAETANRAPNVRGLSSRLNENDAWRVRAGTRLDTLGSDLLSINARIAGLPEPAFTHNLARDLARVKEEINLPDDYTAWGSDHFLDASESWVAHPDYAAKVEEGIRFRDAQITDSQLGLLNPLDERVMSAGNFMVPAFDPVTRINAVGNDAELSISQYAHQTVQAVQRMRSRIRIRWGTDKTVCSNSAWWRSGRYDPITGIFTRGGETWQVLSTSVSRLFPGNIILNKWIRLRQFWRDTYEEPYWENITVTEGINGSVIAESFLNSQVGYLIELGLYFRRKGATGDVHVLITETDLGMPNHEKVIGRTTIAVADIKTWPERTPAKFSPTLLQPGKRYGFILITPGNHYVCLTEGNKFNQGSLFISTDGGGYAQGDLTRDIAFDAVFAQFRSPRVEVQLLPLQNAGGIVGIDINADVALPAGTDVQFEVQHNGVWVPLDAESQITGLPALLPFKAVFLGTTDVMPGLGVLSNSRVRTNRPASDFRHISDPQTTPAPVDTVHVDVRLEGWRAAEHTCLVRLRTGTGNMATLHTATAVVESAAPDDPEYAITRRYSFTIPAGTTFAIDISGTTNNVVTPFHVAERVHIALA